MKQIAVLPGQKFGKLTVIKKGSNYIGPTREYGRWECLCDCGNTILVITNNLNRKSVKSCGCWVETVPQNNCKPGDKYGRLTLISYFKGKWICQCECNNICEHKIEKLISGNTASCGCLLQEKRSINGHKMVAAHRQFEPRIATARNIWKNTYRYRDKQMGIEENQIISFEDFLIISQKNCHYCGVAPSRTSNFFKQPKYWASQKGLEEGDFTFNGMDRIDSSKHHYLENVLPCCTLCNRGKSNRTIEEFKNWINNLQIINKKYEIITKTLPKYYTSSVNAIYHTTYSDGDLSREEFECLSQYDCHYCNSKPKNRHNYVESNKKMNIKNFDAAEFVYNGLDRIDSTLPHNKNNVWPSCKYCNWAKGNLPLQDFHAWIRRIQANINNW